ncbi:hypothetical protein GGR54DRAFT_641477 [Hypoxylon sp. NC1633]|nr:hypothetical protein GGR54DRAFT_641477 [Hypoxylon sp. NC1633]
MPHNSSNSGKKTKSKERTKSKKGSSSTKTHRGSPVPQPPNVPDPSDSSSGAHNDYYNPDLDLLGFGSQFDDNK